jgi:hypothetical protein
MGVKNDFLAALRNLPAGLLEFLDVAIPAVPSGLSIPTTEEEANIMQGILSFYILQFFTAFAGLTPVPLALRIGQHSNVAEALLLSNLEYMPESDANQEFEIVEPVEGKEYAPGDIRIIVKGKGNLSTVTVTVAVAVESKEFTVELVPDNAGKMFYGYARCEEIFDYTFTFVAHFEDNTSAPGTEPQIIEKTQAITVTITADGESVVDLNEFDMAAQKVLADADGIIGGDALSSVTALIESSVDKLIKIVSAL